MVSLSSSPDLLNFVGLIVDQLVVFRNSIEFGHGSTCARLFVAVPIVTRRLGKEHNTDTQQKGPDETHAHGNTVRSGVGSCLSAVVDAVSGEDTNGNEQLITTEGKLAPNKSRDCQGGNNSRDNGTSNGNR